MSPLPPTVVSFGPFVLDPAQRLLSRDGAKVHLSPKAMDLLLVLLEQPGTVVTKADLMTRVWPDTFVEEGNIPVTVFALRKALGDTDEQYIRTVTKFGYAFAAPVTAVAPGTSSSPQPGPEPPAESAATRPSGPSAGQAPTPIAAPTSTQVSGWRLPLRANAARLALAATLAVAVGATTWFMATRRNPPNSTAASAGIGSVAVLPFAVIDATADDALLGAGLAADIVEHLNQASTLRVRPLSSTLKFVDARDAVKAASALKADAAVTGTVRLTDVGAEVTAELVRASDGARLWSMPARPRAVALPSVGTSVANELLGALLSQSDAPGISRITEPTRSGEAYRAYVEGLALANQLTVPEMNAALARFERAVAADPGYADAHAALARFSLLPVSVAPTPVRLQRARLAATRAIALAPQLGGPHGAMAAALIVSDGRWSDGLAETARAIALAPNDAELRLWHAIVLGAQGNHDDALREIDLALALDPTSPRINLYRGILLSMARRYDDAIAQLRQTPLELGVVNQQVYFAIGLASAKKTRYDLGEAAVNRVLNRLGNQQARVHLAFVYAESGDKARAKASLDDALRAPSGAVPPHTIIAATQACLGEMDAAFERLAHARENGDIRVLFAKVDPVLDCARSDPRFPAFVRSLGLSMP